MLAYTYISPGKFELIDKPMPELQSPRDAIVCITLGKIDTTPLITHRYKLTDIAEAYHLFENKLDGVIKVAVEL